MLYYVVEISEVDEDMCQCTWYEFKDNHKLFVKLNVQWPVSKKSLMCFVDPPVVAGSERRGKI